MFTQAKQSAGHPQHIHQQSRQYESATQYFAILYLEWVHHGDILFVPHWLGKEKTTLCNGWEINKYFMESYVNFMENVFIYFVYFVFYSLHCVLE